MWRPLAVALVTAGLVSLGALAPAASTGAPAPSPGPAVRAELVRLPFPQDDGSLTPYTFELGYHLMTLVYDTLLWRDADGQPRPWLARSVTPNADGRQLTIRLNEGARWHDGGPVTADDVAFTFRYMADRPHARFTPALREVERVDVFDPATLVVSLRRASPGFLDQPLADMPILPAHLWRDLPAGKAAPDGLAVGSGPYRMASYEPGQGWQFEADPAYFRGRPAVQALEVPVIRNLEGTLAAFEQRRVDVVTASLPASAAERVRKLGTRVAGGPSYLGTVLLLNTRRAPFDRQEARRAVAAALDPVQLARAVGNAVPATSGYVHPASAWAVPDPGGRAGRPGASTDALPPTIRVMAPDNDPVKLEAGREVVQALTRLGSGATLVTVSRDELKRAVGEDGSPPAFEAAIWSAPPLASYDPGFLAQLFGSDPRDARTNLTGYTSPAFDAAAARMAGTTDDAARRAAVADALAVLATDAPAVPLLFADGAFAYRPAVYDGWVYVKGTGIIDKRSFVEPAPPAAAAADDGPPAAGGGSSFPFGWMAVAVLAVAALVVLWQVAGRSRRGGAAGAT
ncbi:MAG TPA: ABC transporter substrate-binding protein [Acidimicrobiales bacterium]|nr:ABC transporter substrate-binding protein [Acidimicrobiales bacterium]